MFGVTAIVLTVFVIQAAPFEVVLHGRIVNGDNVDIIDYPYMVSLQYYGIHICGGSIIDRYNILTAAHCVKEERSGYSVLYGTSTLFMDHQRMFLSDIRSHENYTGQMPFYHDIAVLHLKHQLPNRQDVVPVRLPTQFSPTPEKELAVLTGWGRRTTDGIVSVVLQEVDIEVYTDEECEWRHSNASRLWNICAGVPEGGKGQCIGDSGGPLVVNGIQVGIVSWSIKPCAVKGYPGVFVKVSSYIDWIRSNVKYF